MEFADVQNVDGRRAVVQVTDVHAEYPQQRRHKRDPDEERRQHEAPGRRGAVAEARLQWVADSDVARRRNEDRQPSTRLDEDVLKVRTVQLVVHQQRAAFEDALETLAEHPREHAKTEQRVRDGLPGEDHQYRLFAVLYLSFVVPSTHGDQVEDVGQDAKEPDQRDDEASEDVLGVLDVGWRGWSAG